MLDRELTNEFWWNLSHLENITSGFDLLNIDVGKLSDKLDSLMARQEETKDQGEFVIEYYVALSSYNFSGRNRLSKLLKSGTFESIS